MRRAAENTALALAAANAGASLWAATSATAAGALKVPLLAGFVLFFVLVLVVVSQATLLARSRSPGPTHLEELEALSSEEWGQVLRRSPRFHKVIGILGVLMLLVTLVFVGGVSWSTGTPFEQRHAVGVALYVTALSAIVAPVLAAFARLPPSVEDRVASLQRNVAASSAGGLAAIGVSPPSSNARPHSAVRRQRRYLIAIVIGSVLSAGYEALFYWYGAEPAGPVVILWPIAFVVLLVLWVDQDSKQHSEVYRPFEFGFLVFVFWIPYLPYYLVRTRGAKGIAELLGFVLLFFLGYLCQ